MSPLRRRMIDDMQIRNLTPNTQRVYIAQVVRSACHFLESPELLGPAEIRAYLIHLTQERHLAASSIIVTVSALRFFYTVTLKRPWIVEDPIPAGRQAKKLPVVLSQEEVARFLGAVSNLKHRVILTVCYATGPELVWGFRCQADFIAASLTSLELNRVRSRATARGQHMGRPPALTAQQQAEARRRRENGATLKELSKSYNVSELTISRLRCMTEKPDFTHVDMALVRQDEARRFTRSS